MSNLRGFYSDICRCFVSEPTHSALVKVEQQAWAMNSWLRGSSSTFHNRGQLLAPEWCFLPCSRAGHVHLYLLLHVLPDLIPGRSGWCCQCPRLTAWRSHGDTAQAVLLPPKKALKINGKCEQTPKMYRALVLPWQATWNPNKGLGFCRDLPCKGPRGDAASSARTALFGFGSCNMGSSSLCFKVVFLRFL